MDARTFGRDIAHIDLTHGKVEKRLAPEEWVRKFVGGRGLGVRYVLENGVEVDPLGPENILLSLIHISEPTRQPATSRMPSSA